MSDYAGVPSQGELDVLRAKMDAKLAELRADPANAAAFRADLHGRMKQAFDKLPKWPVPLHQLISEAFSFLVNEYGFTEHEKTTDGFLGSVTVKEYSSSEVKVRIAAGGIDAGGFCSIGLEEREKERPATSDGCCLNESQNSSTLSPQNRWTSPRCTCRRMPLLSESMPRMCFGAISVLPVDENSAQQMHADDAFKATRT